MYGSTSVSVKPASPRFLLVSELCLPYSWKIQEKQSKSKGKWNEIKQNEEKQMKGYVLLPM